MSSSSRPEQLRRALIEAGIPRRRRIRFLNEYRDHFAETEQELGEAGLDTEQINDACSARLGAPEVLAKVAIDRLRAETFAGRRPALGFTLHPLLALVCALVLLVAATTAPGLLIGQDRVVDLLGVVWPVLLWALPLAGVAWWFRAAARCGRGPGYAWLGAMIFGLPTTFVSTRVIHSDIPLRSVFQFVPEAVPSWTALLLLTACLVATLAARKARR